MRRAEAVRGSDGGLRISDYADMSNEKPSENLGRRNPKASRGRFVRPGSVASAMSEKDSGWGQRLSPVRPGTAGPRTGLPAQGRASTLPRKASRY